MMKSIGTSFVVVFVYLFEFSYIYWDVNQPDMHSAFIYSDKHTTFNVVI